MDKSYNDTVKDITRVKLQNGIRDYILSYRKPKDVRIFCFPGAQKDGEVALELAYYDALGIPRENITGVELDREKYDRLCAAGLGIELIHAKDLEVLKTARSKGRKWTVFNLDYTSYFSPERHYALELIASDGLLDNRGIIATNFMARRENEDAQDLLQCNSAMVKGGVSLQELLTNYEPALTRVAQLNQSFDLREDREQVLRSILTGTFTLGRANLGREFYDCFGGFDESSAHFLDVVSRVGDERDKACISIKFTRNREENVMRHRMFRINEDISRWEALINAGLDFPLASAFLIAHQKPYLVESLESYGYVSNSGTPMLFDIFYLDNHARIVQRLESSFLVRKHETAIYVLPEVNRKESRDRLRAEVKEQGLNLFEKKTKVHELGKQQKRIFLGSSASEKIYLEVVQGGPLPLEGTSGQSMPLAGKKRDLQEDEKQVIRELRAGGATIEDIAMLFNGEVERRKISSVAAWVKINRDRGVQHV